MSAPDRPPPEAPRLRPLARFGTVFAWGLRRTLRGPKFVAAAAVCAGGGYGLGSLIARTKDPAAGLWSLLQAGVLPIAAPLVALGLVGTGFAEEVQDRTILWHLVRPVSRATVFLARFAAGAVAGVLCVVAMTVATVAGSRVALPAAAVTGTAAAAALATLTTGALYYALAALFRRGLVAGLFYTFLVEGFFQSMPGTIQRLALTHHVRSVFHRLTDADFAPLSKDVAEEIAGGPKTIFDSMGMRAVKAEGWTSLGSALLICAGVAAAALWIGARRVGRRDFALKD